MSSDNAKVCQTGSFPTQDGPIDYRIINIDGTYYFERKTKDKLGYDMWLTQNTHNFPPVAQYAWQFFLKSMCNG